MINTRELYGRGLIVALAVNPLNRHIQIEQQRPFSVVANHA